MPAGIYPRTAEHCAKISLGLMRLSMRSGRLAPTEKATSNDIRWAAGFYEGEGSVHCQNGNAHISQKDPWMLERMKALFGGAIYKEKSRELYVWNICGARARGFLQSIYGLLSPRRQKQIREMLQIGVYG